LFNGADERVVETQRVRADAFSQEDFWSAHPCGGEGSFRERADFRYCREPWLPPLLAELAAKHRRILEIGCGQGIDGYFIAAALPPHATYLGIDYSSESVRAAQSMSSQAAAELRLQNYPEFRVANALALDLPDGEFDCVYSMGVMHHAPSPQSCVEEAWRVLKPGGVAYIALYRKYSPKVTVAKCLRRFQQAADSMTSQDRTFYRQLQRYGRSSLSGTMFLECFGVPHMEWYSRHGILDLFRRFEVLELKPVGYNLFRFGFRRTGTNRLGYMWLVKARKPALSATG